MKTYVKPKLMALSLNGNERLCGFCTDNGGTLVPSLTDEEKFALDLAIGNGDGELTPGETRNVFVSVEDTCSPDRLIDIGSYCKFTAAQTGYVSIAFS